MDPAAEKRCAVGGGVEAQFRLVGALREMDPDAGCGVTCIGSGGEGDVAVESDRVAAEVHSSFVRDRSGYVAPDPYRVARASGLDERGDAECRGHGEERQ